MKRSEYLLRDNKKKEEKKPLKRSEYLLKNPIGRTSGALTSSSKVTAAPKSSSNKQDKSYTGVDAEINRREASRSARYSMQPEVRAAEIKRAEARGDTKRASELKKATDIDNWAKEQVNSDFVRSRAQTIYDNEFNAAKLRGDQSPAVAAEHAAQGYLDMFRNKPQETKDETYAFRQAEKILEAASVFGSNDFGKMSESGKLIGVNLDGNLPKSRFEKIITFVNNDPYRNSIEALAIMNHGDSNLAKQISQLTEDEKKIIRYYAARGEKDKVEEFYKLMERELNERLQTAVNKQTRQEAYDKPILGAAKNIVGTMASPAAYIENAGNAVANVFRDEYIPTDYNTPAFRGAHMAEQTSAGVTERASDAAGGGAKGEVASFLAGTGLSIANQIATLPLGAAGSLAYMTAESAGQTTLDALKRGASAEQAMLLGSVSGAIEAITEKIPLDNLFEIAGELGEKGFKKFIKTLVKNSPKQGITEMGEEGISKIANIILDIAVMKEKSGYEQYVAELMKNGMTRPEAEKKALINYVGANTLEAGAAGFLSGMVMGGGATAVSKVNTAIESRNAGAAEGEAGFTKNEFSEKVSNKTIRALDAIGKKLGVNITIGAPTGTGQGSFNGYYENGRIVISQDADDPLKVVLSHEVTQRMKETAPEAYAKFLEIAVNATEQLSGKQKSEILEEYKTWYSDYTQTDFKYEDALDEITADFAGRLADDLSLFKKLVDTDRNVAQRFIDGVREFISKVKSTFSKDKSKADTASLEKYGLKVSELEEAVKQRSAMVKATETAVKSGNVEIGVDPQVQTADNVSSGMSVDDIIDEEQTYKINESEAAARDESPERIIAEQKNTAEAENKKQYSFKKPKAEDSTTELEKSESDEEAFRRAFGDWAYDPEEESSYFDETGLADDAAQNPKEDYSNIDALYADLGQRENIIKEEADEREQELIDGAYKSAISDPATEKKKLSEKISESWNFLKRKIVNSGAAIRDIAKVTKDKYLYPIYNRARGSMNIAEDMLTNKQTNIRGEKVGESLEAIILPIKNKGKEYFREFHLYLLNKHNVARMSLENPEATARAKAELDKFLADNPQIAKLAALGEDAIQNAAKWDDARGFRAKQYLELRNEWQKLLRTKNIPIFFDKEETPLSADISRTKAEELLKKHPEFAEYEAKVRKYLDNLMQYLVDSGLITQEEADYFRKKYPDYVPTYRNKESVLQELYGKKNIGKTLGIARGGVEKLLPLDIALAEMTKKVIRNGQKNIFANKLFGIFEKNSKLLEEYITDVNEGIRELDKQIDEFGEDDLKFKNTVGFYKDGKYIELTMTPKLYEAFAEMSKAPEEKAPVADWWRKLNNAYKKLITIYDPTFILRSGKKDLSDAIINSRDTAALLKNLPKAYKEIATNGEMFELYRSMGGLHSSRFEEIKIKGVEKKIWAKKLPDAIAFGNMMVEQAPRLAEFMSVIEKGDRNDPDVLADALYAAADVTTNFGESGTWGKLLNAYYVPFLNPAIQGAAKIGRLIAEPKTAKQWYGLAAKAVIMGVGAGFINDIIIGIFGDDEEKEEYEKLQDRVKDNYFLIPTDDGKFVRIPKGRIEAALGVIADRVRDVAKGEKVSAGEALVRILENIAPENPITNNILSPFIDAKLFNNESKGRTWYGGDIESDSMQGLPAGERFDSSTDYISKYVGKALGLSPKKINYILKQYTGGAGRTILPMITPSEQKGDTIAGKIGYGALSILTSNFMVDSKLTNKVSGDFYDAVSEAEQKKNSSKGTLADKVVYKHLNRERNQMSGYNKKIREAETDSSLTSKERDVAVRTATASRTEYQKEVLDNLDKYRASVEKYLKEYPGKDEEKAIDYAYRKANYATYGAKYALRVSGGKSVYDKALEKVNRGKTTWEEYYDEYFGKDERRYEKLREKYDISYAEYEAIAQAMSKNSTEEEEIEALHKLGYKRSTARGIRRNFNKVK